jgi:hypothetical protein
MTRRISRDRIYRRRRFSAETIELCVRWYISHRLSYRDLAAMTAERERAVSHTTISAGCCGACRIRAPMGALRTSAGFVLAHGRDGCVCPWRAVLSIPRGGQGRKVRRVIAGIATVGFSRSADFNLLRCGLSWGSRRQPELAAKLWGEAWGSVCGAVRVRGRWRRLCLRPGGWRRLGIEDT